MVNGLYLYSAFLVFQPLKALLHYKPHSHTHSYAEGVQGLPFKVPTCPSEEIWSFTHWWHSHQEQFGVKYLAQGHIDMQTGGIEPPIFQLVDDSLYLLSHSCPHKWNLTPYLLSLYTYVFSDCIPFAVYFWFPWRHPLKSETNCCSFTVQILK